MLPRFSSLLNHSVIVFPILCLPLASVSCRNLRENNEFAQGEGLQPPPAAYPEASYDGYNQQQSSSAPAYGSPGNAPAPPSNYASAPSSAISSPTTPFSQRQTPASSFQPRAGEQLVNHTVQRGDTLSSLAARYGTTVSRIQAANGMSDDRIYADRAIKIPTSQAVAGASSPRPPQNPSYSSAMTGQQRSAGNAAITAPTPSFSTSTALPSSTGAYQTPSATSYQRDPNASYTTPSRSVDYQQYPPTAPGSTRTSPYGNPSRLTFPTPDLSR